MTPLKRHTKHHEWIDYTSEENVYHVGITAYAAKHLDEIINLELPKKGDVVAKEDVVGYLESVKAASDIYTPCAGTIVDVNEAVLKDHTIISKDPEDKGWLFSLKVDAESVCPDECLDLSEYKKLINED